MFDAYKDIVSIRALPTGNRQPLARHLLNSCGFGLVHRQSSGPGKTCAVFRRDEPQAPKLPAAADPCPGPPGTGPPDQARSNRRGVADLCKTLPPASATACAQTPPGCRPGTAMNPRYCSPAARYPRPGDGQASTAKSVGGVQVTAHCSAPASRRAGSLLLTSPPLWPAARHRRRAVPEAAGRAGCGRPPARPGRRRGRAGPRPPRRPGG